MDREIGSNGAAEPTKRGKGTKIIAVADDHSLPLAVSIESASPPLIQFSSVATDEGGSSLSGEVDIRFSR
jgi:hypothetical protein